MGPTIEICGARLLEIVRQGSRERYRPIVDLSHHCGWQHGNSHMVEALPAGQKETFSMSVYSSSQFGPNDRGLGWAAEF